MSSQQPGFFNPDGSVNGYFAPGGAQPAQPSMDFWAQFQPVQTSQTAGFGPQTSNSAMSVADRFRQFGQQNGGDPSAVNDPNYWAGIYNEKVSKGADPTETFNYLTGRITNGSGGGGGFSGGGSYTPLAPFQYGGSFSTFSAPSVNAPAAFSYNGPGVTMPQNFNFPGVYSQQPPTADYNNWTPPATTEAAGGGTPATSPDGTASQSSAGGTQAAGGVQSFVPPSQTALPGPFSNPALANATPYQQASSFTSPGVQMPSAYQTASPYSYDALGKLGTFDQSGKIDAGTPYTPGSFTATTAQDLQADPGYQFRQDQQRKALEQTAAGRGTLNSTGTQKAVADYAGQLASQEFANVDARRRADFNTREANLADAYKTNLGASLTAQQGTFGNELAKYGANTNTALQEQATRYNQGLGAAQFNEANRLNAYNATEPLKLQAQAQQFGQDFNTAQFNEANRANAYNTNEANRQAIQAQQYGQAANTYGMNYQNAFNNNQANYTNALNTFNANQGAQNQAYNQALSQAQFNANNALTAQQQAWQQQYTPWAANASNQLAAGQTNAQLAGQTNALNAGQEQARYQADWNAYQNAVQQAQFASTMGLNYGQLGLQANNQAFNQGLQTYNTNYQTQVADPWNRNFQTAQLGANAAGQLGNLGAQYGGNLSDLYTGIGNAQAGSQIASGVGYQNALGSLGQIPYSYYAYNDSLNNRTAPFYAAYQGPQLPDPGVNVAD